MKAPMSSEIAALLQNPRTARQLVDAILKSRTLHGRVAIEVRQNDTVKRYTSVSGLHRSKSA